MEDVSNGQDHVIKQLKKVVYNDKFIGDEGARELAGFIWKVAHQAYREQNLQQQQMKIA